MTEPKVLITLPELVTFEEWTNDLTRAMDEHLRKEWESTKSHFNTYLLVLEGERNIMVIRFPGATRGAVEFDDDMIITDIHLYDTAFENTSVSCYKPSVAEAVKPFIGMKIVLERNGESNV